MRIAATLSALARVLVYHRLEDRQVPGLLREALDLSVALGERVQTVELLEVVAHFAAGSGDAEVAAELVGAADAERERSMSERVPDQHPYFEATARDVERALGLQAYIRGRERGRMLSLEAAVALALGATAPSSQAA